MELPRPPSYRSRESIVPMINVVFLLLIFFLMTAQIRPPEPFEVVPPEARAENPADGRAILHVGADGQLAFGDLRGEEVHAGLAALGPDDVLLIRADRSVPATRIAGLLGRIAGHGIGAVKLVSEQR